MSGNEVPAVARALTLIEALAAAPQGLPARALEDIDDGSRSGMYALLATLRHREWLVQDDSGNYGIGPAIRRITPSVADDETSAVEALAAVLDTNPETLSETIVLSVPDAQGLRTVASHHPDRTVHASFRVGDRRSPESAPARLMRADLDPSLERIRVIAVATTSNDDIVEVAAPVCRDGHRPDCVVSLVMPRQRATQQSMAAGRDQIRALAAEVSRRLGASIWQPWGVGGGPVATSRTLERDEVQDLLTGRFGAQLACLTDTGTPHVVPLWFEYADEVLWLAASPGSSWARYLRGGAPVSLTIEEPWPHLRRVFIQGQALPLDPDEVDNQLPGGVAGLRGRLAQRYLGTAVVPEDRASVQRWSVVKVTPDRIIGRAGLQGVAA